MIQVNATYKPGDRPESLIRYSGGLSAKTTAPLPLVFFCPLLCKSTIMRGRRKRIHMQKIIFDSLLLTGSDTQLHTQETPRNIPNIVVKETLQIKTREIL